MTAVLLQMVLFDVRQTGLLAVLSVTDAAVVLLAVTGVWLNQQAYRAGNVAVVLAVVTVSDPAASAITAVMLGEQFPTDVFSLSLLATSAAVTAGGIAWIARSPAHTAVRAGEVAISPRTRRSYRAAPIQAVRGASMAQGTVKWFNSEKGFGFISNGDGPDVFVHHSEIDGSGYRSLEENQQVEFEINQGPKGPQAVHVRVV